MFKSEKLLFAEIKNSRPNKNFYSTLSLDERLRAYEKADAISVVTHSSFAGSLDLLKSVRRLTTKPILAKDFIRTANEVLSLKQAGANGILLLKDMLTFTELSNLIECCKKIGVTSFVESSFHFPEEGDFSVLNSRSLFSLQENKNFRDFVAQTSLIKSLAESQDRTIIASSLETPLSVRFALSENRGCIVGSAFMGIDKVTDIENFIQQSKQKSLLIKFCGARTKEDLELALHCQVDFIGINLIPSSKRFIGQENLIKLIPSIEKFPEKICFITRNDACPQCIELVSHLSCHEQAYCAPLLPNRKNLFSLPFANFMGSTALILDGEKPGSGIPTSYPVNNDNVSTPIFISAGITSSNFLDKKREAQEKNWNVVGIDCSSAVCFDNLTEQTNAFSINKMQNFIDALRK